MTKPTLTRRQAQTLGTKRKLEARARLLFSSTPYEQVTIRMIASTLGLSTGALFGHFSGKAELWKAAMGAPYPWRGMEIEPDEGHIIGFGNFAEEVLDSACGELRTVIHSRGDGGWHADGVRFLPKCWAPLPADPQPLP